MQFHLTAAKTNETQAAFQRFQRSRRGTGAAAAAAANCLCVLPRTQLSQWTHTKSPSVLLLFALLADCVRVCACAPASLWPFVYFIPSFVNCHYFVMVNPLRCLLTRGSWRAVKLGVMLPSGATTAAWANCQSPVIGLAKCLTPPLYNCSTWPTRFFAFYFIFFSFFSFSLFYLYIVFPRHKQSRHKNDKLTALIGYYVLLQSNLR